MRASRAGDRDVGKAEGTQGGVGWEHRGKVTRPLIPEGAASAPVGLDPSYASQPGFRSPHSALPSGASAPHPRLSRRVEEWGPAIHCTAHLLCLSQGS